MLGADRQVDGQADMDWEEQRSELIEGLLSTSSPCQLAAQEAVSVLLYMAQDDSSASGSGAESPQVGPPFPLSAVLACLSCVLGKNAPIAVHLSRVMQST